jgi:6-phosphogluconolactonase
MVPQVVRTTNFARDAACFILDHAGPAIAKRGLFRLGLAGGNTPRLVYEQLATLSGNLLWSKVQITFGDERCVSPAHQESNYLMARESLLERVGLPESNVIRIRGEIAPQTAAAECEKNLALIASRFGEARYAHDLLLLGLGPDGHTASLFPGSPALAEKVRNVVPVRGPKPPAQRITFTFPLINASRRVCFLVNDASKQPVLDAIVAGKSALPAALVQPTSGALTWMIAS